MENQGRTSSKDGSKKVSRRLETNRATHNTMRTPAVPKRDPENKKQIRITNPRHNLHGHVLDVIKEEEVHYLVDLKITNGRARIFKTDCEEI